MEIRRIKTDGLGARARRFFTTIACLCPLLAATSCRVLDAPVTLEFSAALHLEDQLEAARVESGEAPTEVPNQVVWKFAGGAGSWRSLRISAAADDEVPSGAGIPHRRNDLVRVDDELRLHISKANRVGNVLVGGIYTELDNWNFEDWGMVVLRARTRQPVTGMLALFELDGDMIPSKALSRLLDPSEIAPMFSDGTELTYAFPVRRPDGTRTGDPWTRLAIAFAVSKESSLESYPLAQCPRRNFFRGRACGPIKSALESRASPAPTQRAAPSTLTRQHGSLTP